MGLSRVYKNLYYDTDEGRYYFVNGNDRRAVVDQHGYLLIYLIEIILGVKKDEGKTKVFNKDMSE